MHSILFFLNSGLSDRRDYLCLKTGRDYWKVNACDFFLWGHMKQLVYRTPVNIVKELINRIQNAAAEIRANTDMTSRTQQSLIRRAEACTQNERRHFEHLL